MYNLVIFRPILTIVLPDACAGDKIEKNEMGWACGAYGCGEGGV